MTEIKTKQKIHGQLGFTLVELLVTIAITLVVMVSVLTTVVSLKNDILDENARINASDLLSSTLQLVGSDIRLVGRDLDGQFPAIEISDGGLIDQLRLRRKKINKVLTLCEDLPVGQSTLKVATQDGIVGYFSPPSAVPIIEPSCEFAGPGASDNLDGFKTARLATTSNIIRAFIYNPNTKQGEFFNYTGESENAGLQTRTLNASSGSWSNPYPLRSLIFIIEEHLFQIGPDGATLEVIVDGDIALPKKVAPEIKEFNVTAMHLDGSERATFTGGENWKEIRRVNITLATTQSTSRLDINRSITGSFCPRNVL